MHWMALLFWLTLIGIVSGAYIIEIIVSMRQKKAEEKYAASGCQDLTIVQSVDDARRRNFQVACCKS